MKKLSLFFCIFLQFLWCEKSLYFIKNDYSFVDLGIGPAPLPLPLVGIGMRKQRGYHGYNLSGKILPNPNVGVLQVQQHYLYFIKPNLKGQFYTGLGNSSGIAVVFSKHKKCDGFIFTAPSFLFGKEYLNKNKQRRFFEANIMYPVVSIQKKKHNLKIGKIVWAPMVTFFYGFTF